MMQESQEKQSRGLLGRSIMLATLCVTLLLLLSLGTWQVQRLGWKKALIVQVESRIHAEPVDIAPPKAWAGMSPETEAYRRIRLSGSLLQDKRLFVYATTDRGPGYWVMMPMQLASDPQAVVWINQGYVTNEIKHQASANPALLAGPVAGESASVTGLLRASEVHRFYMRDNVPAENRWYVRTVNQMSQAVGLASNGTVTAPFFVDADQGPDPTAYPVGGLTHVQFYNNHLAYALTWYGLAVLNVAVLFFIVRTEWLPRRRRARQS